VGPLFFVGELEKKKAGDRSKRHGLLVSLGWNIAFRKMRHFVFHAAFFRAGQHMLWVAE